MKSIIKLLIFLFIFIALARVCDNGDTNATTMDYCLKHETPYPISDGCSSCKSGF